MSLVPRRCQLSQLSAISSIQEYVPPITRYTVSARAPIAVQSMTELKLAHFGAFAACPRASHRHRSKPRRAPSRSQGRGMQGMALSSQGTPSALFRHSHLKATIADPRTRTPSPIPAFANRPPSALNPAPIQTFRKPCRRRPTSHPSPRPAVCLFPSPQRRAPTLPTLAASPTPSKIPYRL